MYGARVARHRGRDTRLLARAIGALGSASAVAIGLGLHPSTGRRWQAKGVIPERHHERLERLIEIQRAFEPPKRKRVPQELTKPLEKAGTRTELARQLKMPTSTVRGWFTRGKVPIQHLPRLLLYVSKPKPPKPKKERVIGPKQLEKALKQLGSEEALARACKVKPDTVRRWKREGMTSVAKECVEKVVPKPKRKRKPRPEITIPVEAPEPIETVPIEIEFADPRDPIQFGLARFLDEIGTLDPKEKKQLKKEKDFSGRREGDHTSGIRETKRWDRYLTEYTLDSVLTDIRDWFVEVGSNANELYYQCLVHVAQISEEGYKVGYQSILYRQIEPKKKTVLFWTNIISRRSTSLHPAVQDVISGLEDVVDLGNEALVVSTSLFNYRLRGEDERRKFQTAKRYERRRVRDALRDSGGAKKPRRRGR